MGAFQPWHLIVVLVIALIVFGPGKLPDIGSALGKSVRDFKAGISGADEEPKAATGSETSAVHATTARTAVEERPGESALEILQRRFAAGEITREQYETMRQALER